MRERSATEEVALVDILDHLLDRGAVLVGKSTISVADVDLVYLGINLVLSSVETLQQERPESTDGTPAGPGGLPGGPQLLIQALPEGKGRGSATPHLAPPYQGGERGGNGPQVGLSSWPALLTDPGGKEEGRVPANQRPDRSLAQLVLTLIELLRQLVERQAVRRMVGGRLPEEKVEEMGRALMDLESKMAELREIFQLEEGDIQVDLGPLGKLL